MAEADLNKPIEIKLRHVAGDQAGDGDLLIELAGRVVRDSGVDSLDFAGQQFSGLAHRARDCTPVPIIDPIAAAVKQAEALVALALRKAVMGSFKRPASKASIGLPPSLSAYIAQLDGPPSA